MTKEQEKKEIQKKRTRIFNTLYSPIFQQTSNQEKPGDLPEGEKDITISQIFLDDFLKNAKEGKRWCEEAAMHWAEILTFPFSHMIITFDLGVFAFIGVMRESFFSQ